VAFASVLRKGGIVSFQIPIFRSLFLGFLAGMSYYQFRDTIRWRGWVAALAALAAAVSCDRWEFDLVLPLALPYVVLYLAHRLPFERVERWGDFSYGIYIYAFPIQQCLALARFQRFGILAFLGASMILTVLAGMASWFALERPALQWARTFTRRRAILAEPADAACQLELLPEKH
jgi:peptidoglycan/LPS O-acetylase OafA/YrhL